ACNATALDIEPFEQRPLGVGLVERFRVSLACAGCEDETPSIHVEHSGSAVDIVDVTSSRFSVAGREPGTADIAVTSNGGEAHITVDVVEVGSTAVSVPQREGDGRVVVALQSPVHAFLGSSLDVDQVSTGVHGEAVAGKAELEIAPGATGVRVDSTC